MDAVNSPLNQTINAKQMLAKINFPREALVVSGIYQTLFNGAIKLTLLIIALIFWGIYPGWSVICFFLGILSLILTGTALGLLLTPMGVLYTDIGKSLPLLLQFLMYFTPVVFPMPESGGWAATIFNLNPLTPLIMTTRNWLIDFKTGFLGNFILVNIVVFLIILVVWIIYRIAMPILIERMSA
jgi:lipopolysaccharide transport system permease protein